MSTTLYNTIMLNPDTWDLTLDSGGNIALATHPYAVAQDVACAIRTFLGEVYYDTTLGVPYNQELLNQSPTISEIIMSLNDAALTVPGVATANTTITSIENRQLKGTVQFTTSEGSVSTVNF